MDKGESIENLKPKNSHRAKTPLLNRCPPEEYDTLASSSKKKSFYRQKNALVNCDTCVK